jgi:hypothetical protein
MASHQAKQYTSEARALVSSVLGSVVVSFTALTAVIALGLKHFIAGSNWLYCLLSAVLIMIGVSLCVLSTAIALKDQSNSRY